ncbi:hypothetical protein [Salmonella enterica]|uniref:hypothetical protein n=1 Tax=Salmonella enterica TaxID=28901 RepID=UPI003D2FE5F0
MIKNIPTFHPSVLLPKGCKSHFGCEMEKLSGFERYKLVAYVDFSSRDNQTQFGSIL